MKKILAESALIIIVSILLGCMVNIIRPHGIPFVGDWRNISAKDSENGYISVDTAHSLWSNRQATFVDARSDSDFAQGRIPGALNIPRGNENMYFPILRGTTGFDATIVVYCSSETCDDSIVVAEYLKRQGYTSINLYKGGIVKWIEKGYPLEK